MSRRRPRNNEELGLDSFLDIVANLVGILIILIMLVGARAKDAFSQAVTAAVESNVPEVSQSDVASSRDTAAAVESDVHNLDLKIRVQQTTVLLRRGERDNIQALVSALEKHLSGQTDQLEQSERESFDLQRELTAAQSQLQDLKRSRDVVARSAAPTVIKHLPTPMAKTVFGKEIHFRLLGGRLTFVPWHELLERLQAEAPQKQWKLKATPRITETIGPLRGFWLKYSLRRGQFIVETEAGPVRRTGIQFEGFVLTATSDDLGEPLEIALRANSEFAKMTAGLDPDRTTITVWVYPDSFDQFRQLKEALFKRGFVIASRPMPAGHPIGGSPDGSRSAAQ